MKVGTKEFSHVIDGLLNLLCGGDGEVEWWRLALWQAAYDLLGLRARGNLASTMAERRYGCRDLIKCARLTLPFWLRRITGWTVPMSIWRRWCGGLWSSIGGWCRGKQCGSRY